MPTIYAGPAISGRLSAEVEGTIAGRTITVGLDDEVTAFDTSVVLGLELGVPSGRRQFTIEARYTQGLGSIDDSGATPAADVKNRVFSIVIGGWFATGE